jgi:thioredoxin reductase
MTRVAVIGAGPYGLAVAAHLRRADVPTTVFGGTMDFWAGNMPAGMLLRSYWSASHIADPGGALTLDAYQAGTREVPRPVPVERFVSYGRWFAMRAVPDVDPGRIELLEDDEGGGFRLTTRSGTVTRADRVVVATGIAAFARRPAVFADLPPELVSHSSEHPDLSVFAGRRIAVIGGGQSALESAALLHEAGAEVEVLVRADEIRWLRYGTDSRLHAALHSDKNPVKDLLFPASDIGPPGINLLVDKPALFNAVPTRGLRDRIAYRAIRPAGSGWLRTRLAAVPITTGTAPVAASATDGCLRIHLDVGGVRTVDHALLATGYAPDLARISFLDPSLLRRIRRIGTYPRLSAGFESSAHGLHFVGATAAMSFGPLMRFVAGTGYAAGSVTRAVTGDRTMGAVALSRDGGGAGA